MLPGEIIRCACPFHLILILIYIWKKKKEVSIESIYFENRRSFGWAAKTSGWRRRPGGDVLTWPRRHRRRHCRSAVVAAVVVVVAVAPFRPWIIHARLCPNSALWNRGRRNYRRWRPREYQPMNETFLQRRINELIQWIKNQIKNEWIKMNEKWQVTWRIFAARRNTSTAVGRQKTRHIWNRPCVFSGHDTFQNRWLLIHYWSA